MRLILHAGLHRAGSSSIQGVLEGLSAPLAGDRVLAVTQTRANDPAHRAFKLLRGHKVAERGLAAVRDALNRHFQTLAGDFDTIVFSDENMPGFMPGKRQAAFAHAGDLAALIGALRRDHDVHVVVVVREHVGYLHSVHNFRLARSECGEFAEFAAGLDLASLAMAPMLETIAAATGPDGLSVHAFDRLDAGQSNPVLATLGRLAGSELLAEAVLPQANRSRNPAELAFFRAMNAAGVFLPLRAPRQRLIDLIRSMPEFPSCSDADRQRLLDLLRTEASRLPFAVSSERRLRLAGKLHAKGAGRLLPGVSAAKLEALLQHCAGILEQGRDVARADALVEASLWQRFAPDRQAIAARWLPDWRDLSPPG